MKNNITTILAENPSIAELIVLNSIRNCILENYFSVVMEPGLFQCYPNAIFQLGINYHTLDDTIDLELRKVLDSITIDKTGDLQKQLDVLSEEVLKQWKQILNR
ncbi:Uncharacterised protein [Algoriella xinjiangensis]|uniref:hypothetical protein n=1 Tax=Algoriella xinjiangensis TaxID=684065 RepID=UPI000F62D5EE|nr:hypothetical protein [Algoriella xinjiangensis]VDH16853.1 Uncharacterised protein [Algoriella xinjiangensis]